MRKKRWLSIEIQQFTVPASTLFECDPATRYVMKVTRRFIKVQTVLMYVSGFRKGNNKLYHFRLIIIHNCTHINIKLVGLLAVGDIFLLLASVHVSFFSRQSKCQMNMVPDSLLLGHRGHVTECMKYLPKKSFVFHSERGLNFAVDQH